MSLLISLGAKVSTVDKQKYTPLHSGMYQIHDTFLPLSVALLHLSPSHFF